MHSEALEDLVAFTVLQGYGISIQPLCKDPVSVRLTPEDLELLASQGYNVSDSRAPMHRIYTYMCGLRNCPPDQAPQELGPGCHCTIKQHMSCNAQRNRKYCARTDCKFKMLLFFSWANNVWTNRVVNPNHNHEPGSSPLSDSLHHKFTFEEVQTVGQQWQIGTTNRGIKNLLESDAKKWNIVVYHTPKDIVNLVQHLRIEQLDGFTSIQYLVLLFKKQGI
jgi:hypothetical protein